MRGEAKRREELATAHRWQMRFEFWMTSRGWL
jgi:hypothetical protein